MPNIRFKLPSRNWLIFLSISGTFASLLLYDRYQKQRAQQKWSTAVSHLSRESLDTTMLPRKLTVYLSAPPGDGLKASRDYFNEYVKPVLVAGALEWEVVEGRREGDVRAGLAERIRKWRRKNGEGHASESRDEADAEDVVAVIREKGAVREWDGTRGDLIVGRHTWKEYMRGLHEGWLGPLDPPPGPDPKADDLLESSTNASDSTPPAEEDTQEFPLEESGSTTPKDTPPSEPDTPPSEPNKASKPMTPASFIQASAYASSTPPPSIPSTFDPSTPIPLPHILGFFNTPTRIYRFLTRRFLADSVGREVAAAVLAASTRPYRCSSTARDLSGPDQSENCDAEQSTVLADEETDWIKSVTKRQPDEGERVWLDAMALDARIAERMQRFELSAEDEARVQRIAASQEGARDEASLKMGDADGRGAVELKA